MGGALAPDDARVLERREQRKPQCLGGSNRPCRMTRDVYSRCEGYMAKNMKGSH